MLLLEGQKKNKISVLSMRYFHQQIELEISRNISYKFGNLYGNKA